MCRSWSHVGWTNLARAFKDSSLYHCVQWIHRGFTVNENVLHPLARFRRKHHLDDMPKIPFPRESCVRSWREPSLKVGHPCQRKNGNMKFGGKIHPPTSEKDLLGSFFFSWWYEGSAPLDLCDEPMLSLISRRKRDTDIVFVLTS